MFDPRGDNNFKRALAFQQSGQWQQAEALYKRCVEAAPGFSEGWRRLGQVALMSGRKEDALSAISLAAKLAPGDVNCVADVGVVHWKMGNDAAAKEWFQRALSIVPSAGQIHRNLSDVCLRQGSFEEAAMYARNAIRIDANDSQAYVKLGDALRSAGRYAEAAQQYEASIHLNPTNLAAYCNLCDAHVKMNRFQDGIEAIDRGLRVNAQFSDLYRARGVAWYLHGKFREAEEELRKAIELDPTNAAAALALALVLLIQGRFEEGWKSYEARWHTPQLAFGRQLNIPRWRGDAMPGGRLLVCSEQGLGDAIQFIRYFPLVREQSCAAEVVFEVGPELLPLIRGQLPVVERNSSEVEVARGFDQYVPLMSLPLALRRYAPVPMLAPYIHADESLLHQWRVQLGERQRLRVGIVWAGNPRHIDDSRRSLRPELIVPFVKLPTAEFYSLQLSGVPTCLAECGVRDLGISLKSFADTAALLKVLDLVVSVDTSVAHLAGSMGLPVWTLITSTPDWRWGLVGERTTLYPTMRLFRQPKPGDWDSVVEAVISALRVEVSVMHAQIAS